MARFAASCTFIPCCRCTRRQRRSGLRDEHRRRIYRLGDGESLLWDDTYRHELWNRSDQVRVALLLDVWRRDMPADIALLSQTILLATKAMLRLRGVSYGG